MTTDSEIDPQIRYTYTQLLRRAEAAVRAANDSHFKWQQDDKHADEMIAAVNALETAYPGLAAEAPKASKSLEAPAPGESRTPVYSDRMRTKEAVLHVLRAHGDWWPISQITKTIVAQELLAGSIKDNDNRVKVATVRLAQDGELDRRKGPGRGYQFRYRGGDTLDPEGA